MYAKLKTGKILTGKTAEVLTKLGIAKECDTPVKKQPIQKTGNKKQKIGK